CPHCAAGAPIHTVGAAGISDPVRRPVPDLHEVEDRSGVGLAECRPVRIWAIVQARLGSTRFPAKIAARLGDRSVLQHVLARARRIPGVAGVRTAFPEDAPGRDEADVLGRYADLARLLACDAVMRLTADCPLLDPAASALVVERFLEGDVDYCSNVWPRRTWPDGLDTEIFTTRRLLEADRRATDAADREHVTPWIRRHATKIASIELQVDWSWVRLTVDTPEDLAWLQTALAAPRTLGAERLPPQTFEAWDQGYTSLP